MAGNKSLQYAEQQLGVHTLYEETQKLLAELNELLSDLDKAQDQKRLLSDQIADREADVLGEEQGKHPEMSATALDQRVRTAKRQDTMLVELRSKMREVQSTVGGLDYDLEYIRSGLRVREARLIQMGGYLNYLAAIKQAENLTRQLSLKDGQV